MSTEAVLSYAEEFRRWILAYVTHRCDGLSRPHAAAIADRVVQEWRSRPAPLEA